MRAGRLVAPGTMVCEEVPIQPPGEGEVTVRTRLASICGSDVHTVFPASGRVEGLPRPPGFPGHEAVGEVVESNVPDLQPGDLVLTAPSFVVGMCFAEYQTIAGRYCLKLPHTEAPPEHLLMAQQLGTVVFAFKRRPVDVAGRSVVIIGQGSAGVFFAMLARRAGAASIVATDLSPSRLRYGRQVGVDVAIDASTTDPIEAVREATGGRGGHLVIEAVGSGVTLQQSIEMAAFDGNVLWFGLPEGPDDVPFRFVDFFRKRLTASSVWGAQEEPGLAPFQEAVDLIASGEIDVSPLVSHVLPIEQIGEAFTMAHEHPEGVLKVSVSF
jgi:L-iditol 2-dehydrogenase